MIRESIKFVKKYFQVILLAGWIALGIVALNHDDGIPDSLSKKENERVVSLCHESLACCEHISDLFVLIEDDCESCQYHTNRDLLLSEYKKLGQLIEMAVDPIYAAPFEFEGKQELLHRIEELTSQFPDTIFELANENPELDLWDELEPILGRESPEIQYCNTSKCKLCRLRQWFGLDIE